MRREGGGRKREKKENPEPVGEVKKRKQNTKKMEPVKRTTDTSCRRLAGVWLLGASRIIAGRGSVTADRRRATALAIVSAVGAPLSRHGAIRQQAPPQQSNGRPRQSAEAMRAGGQLAHTCQDFFGDRVMTCYRIEGSERGSSIFTVVSSVLFGVCIAALFILNTDVHDLPFVDETKRWASRDLADPPPRGDTAWRRARQQTKR